MHFNRRATNLRNSLRNSMLLSGQLSDMEDLDFDIGQDPFLPFDILKVYEIYYPNANIENVL